MWTRSSLYALLLLWLALGPAHADGANGSLNFPDFTGGIAGPNLRAAVAPPPPPFFTPTVQSLVCNVPLPVTTGVPVTEIDGSLCTYTALCSGHTCTGGNSIINWIVTTQSCASCFDIDSSGNVLGGVNAAHIANSTTYTVTVEAQNASGFSPPVVQTINIPPISVAPVVQVNNCQLNLPVVNGSDVALAGGGTCTYTALCAGVACTDINAVTAWAVTAQSCASCFQVSNLGTLQGSSNANTVTGGNTYTVTVTATNAVGTSAAVVENITVSPVATCISWQTGACLAWNGAGNEITYQ